MERTETDLSGEVTMDVGASTVDDFVAPAPVHFDAPDDLPEVCPLCTRPTKKHTATQAFKCMTALEEREREQAGDPPPPAFTHPLHTITPRPAPPPAPTNGYSFHPVDRDKREPVTAPAPVVTAPPVAAGAEAPVVVPVERRSVNEIVDELDEEFPNFEEVANAAMSGLKGVDYDALASAVHGLIERKMKEVRRHGTTIEQQHEQMKLRLAEQISETIKWRQRAQANAERANSFEKQLEEKNSQIRKMRKDMAQAKSKDHVRKNELVDILDAIDKTPGWSRVMGGNGHWKIYYDDVFISDAAGSGGSNQVNRATRVKLRKAGLNV